MNGWIGSVAADVREANESAVARIPYALHARHSPRAIGLSSNLLQVSLMNSIEWIEKERGRSRNIERKHWLSDRGQKYRFEAKAHQQKINKIYFKINGVLYRMAGYCTCMCPLHGFGIFLPYQCHELKGVDVNECVSR